MVTPCPSLASRPAATGLRATSPTRPHTVLLLEVIAHCRYPALRRNDLKSRRAGCREHRGDTCTDDDNDNTNPNNLNNLNVPNHPRHPQDAYRRRRGRAPRKLTKHAEGCAHQPFGREAVVWACPPLVGPRRRMATLTSTHKADTPPKTPHHGCCCVSAYATQCSFAPIRRPWGWQDMPTRRRCLPRHALLRCAAYAMRSRGKSGIA